MRSKGIKAGDEGLDGLRDGIDECDRQIIRLLARRFELAKEIGRYKAIHNLPILDEAREKELLSDRICQAPAGDGRYIEEIFKLILDQSRQIQRKLRESAGRPEPSDSAK